jgi:hypothetical protein
MRRRDFIALIASTAASPLLFPRVAKAQRAHRIGAMFWGVGKTLRKRQPRVIAFRQGLEDLGWKEGRDLDIEFRWIRMDGDNEIQAAELLSSAPDLILTEDPAPMSIFHPPTRTIPILQITNLAASNRLPAVYPRRQFAARGGLISYEIDTANLYRGVAFYVDRILKGAYPANLLVQAPAKYELVIDRNAARRIGLTVPSTGTG